MSTRKRWTNEEDEMLVQAIKANPHNLHVAFNLVAVKTGRTKDTVRIRWYEVVRHKSYCFLTISRDKKMYNSKTYSPESGHTKAPKETSISLWRRIKVALGWK